MSLKFAGNPLAKTRRFHLAIAALAGLLASTLAASADDKKPAPCTEDAMIVFDASGSMSGNQTLGIPNSRARIDEVRSADEPAGQAAPEADTATNAPAAAP